MPTDPTDTPEIAAIRKLVEARSKATQGARDAEALKVLETLAAKVALRLIAINGQGDDLMRVTNNLVLTPLTLALEARGWTAEKREAMKASK